MDKMDKAIFKMILEMMSKYTLMDGLLHHWNDIEESTMIREELDKRVLAVNLRDKLSSISK